MAKIHHLFHRGNGGNRGPFGGRYSTKFISIQTDKCLACWKCVEACPSEVIGKIDIIIHKHAVVDNRDECTGCRKCVKACECNAISPLKQ